MAFDPAHHRRTLKRIEHQNHARSLTFSCFGRRPFLRSGRACRWAIEGIRLARERHPIHLWAFCVMPTHVHLLIHPRDPSMVVGPVLSTVKQSVAKRARHFLVQRGRPFPRSMIDRSPRGREVFRFWQRGTGFDRNISNPEVLWNEIQYIHRNPVEKGMCAREEEYPWSSARAYVDPKAGPLVIDRESIPVKEHRGSIVIDP